MNGSALAKDPLLIPHPPPGSAFPLPTFRHDDPLVSVCVKGWNRVAGLANPRMSVIGSWARRNTTFGTPVRTSPGSGSPFVLSLTLFGDSPRLP